MTCKICTMSMVHPSRRERKRRGCSPTACRRDVRSRAPALTTSSHAVRPVSGCGRRGPLPAGRRAAHGREEIRRGGSEFSLEFCESARIVKTGRRAPMCTDPPMRTWEPSINLDGYQRTAESCGKSTLTPVGYFSPMCNPSAPPPSRQERTAEAPAQGRRISQASLTLATAIPWRGAAS